MYINICVYIYTVYIYLRAQDLETILQQQLGELEVLILQHLHQPGPHHNLPRYATLLERTSGSANDQTTPVSAIRNRTINSSAGSAWLRTCSRIAADL